MFPCSLPLKFLRKNKKVVQKEKFKEWNREIMCLPNELCRKGEIVIPRGRYRSDLAACGLTGKLKLNSHMSESDIYNEIRSVFSVPMKDDENFRFDILQNCWCWNQDFSRAFEI